MPEAEGQHQRLVAILAADAAGPEGGAAVHRALVATQPRASSAPFTMEVPS